LAQAQDHEYFNSLYAMANAVPDSCKATAKLGQHVYTVGQGNLHELRDSTGLRGDADALRKRFAEDGYVFLRGVIPAQEVINGRLAVLKHLEAQNLIDPCFPLDAGVVKGGHGGDQGRVEGTDTLIRTKWFKDVVEHPALFSLFDDFFGKPAATFDFKWLRAVQPKESSGFHMDSVYMSRGSPNLVTCWVPFGDVPWELGGLAVLGGSHKSEGYQRIRETYGNLDLDRDDVSGTGWFTEDPEEALHFGGQFGSAHFLPGDVVFFGMHTLHGSAVNRTNQWRISCDVRFQPKDEPIDSRWIFNADGEIPGLTSRWVLHRHDSTEFPKTIEDAKKKWGVHWEEQAAVQNEPPAAKRPKV
jgi:hypothetical protein